MRNSSILLALTGARIESGYTVPGHLQSHIALFNSEPLVYTNPHLWVVYFLIMLSLGIACIVLIGRRRRDRCQEKPNWSIPTLDSKKNEVVDEEEAFLRLKRLNDRLLGEIKSLDSQFTSGKIPEERYQDLREQKKEMLVRVKIRLKDLTDG
ncbi:hypothetical protein Desdi_1148 [Desulfitobacterium dichloroeliminans LMG P-21439]|uniref:Uncharacterized protein n=1 Tax=Desulfitobacterium dichloroeliminans (strain LMG P-21439 / DCA1) TaxID=871963 RepID=L0F654_DESDL|nr:hypothetical protein Desdi_1148 [Desulfitobacterium dichloroeliminans LMG P-21439]